MVSEQLTSLLPTDFESTLIIPKIVLHLQQDSSACFGQIVVTGDVSHYRWTDNPIIEIFRAVEQAVRQEDSLPLSVGCPTYSSATGTTKCSFLPHNDVGYIGETFENAFERSLTYVREPFEALLTAFFNAEDGGFRDYQIYHELLHIVDGGNKDTIDEIRTLCNKSIKDFIKENGYALPKRRLVPKIEQPQDQLLVQIVQAVTKNIKASE